MDDAADDALVANALYALAQASMTCSREEDFQALVRGPCRLLFPHRALVAAIGLVDLDHVELKLLLPVDHPPEALASLGAALNLRERSALAHWLHTREPLVLSLSEHPERLSERERDELERFGLGRIAAHGALDVAAQSGSYFSFSNVPGQWAADAVARRLRLVVPLLHEALMNVLRHREDARPVRSELTGTERELLRWVAAGRTNGEIARLRARSPATVRNQLSTLFRKLGASNRAEAVRLAGSYMH